MPGGPLRSSQTRGQSLYSQFLESLSQSRRHRFGRGKSRQNDVARLSRWRAPFHFVSANPIRARSAIAWQPMDSTNPARGDFRPLHRLVPGAWPGRRMGGWLFGRQLAWLNGFKPLHTLHFGAASIALYSGLLALGANIIVAILVSAALRRFPRLDDNSVSGHCSELQSGQRVLVHGSAGAVGNLAIQLAHAAGAEVIATCRALDVAFVTKMGADEVIDIEATDFVLGTKPVNLVIDTVGGETQRRSFHVIAPGAGWFP
jgi:Zinc-binding dehydrogenase